MGKKKKNYQVRNSAGKKYNGSKESKQKAVAKQNTSRPKSQLLDDPIKDDVKVVGGAAEAKEPNRIEELKSQIEKLQAEKQAYYEVSQEGESAVVNAEKKDAGSINRTKIDIEIYNLQSELRNLIAKEAEANEKNNAEPIKDEESKDNSKEPNRIDELKSRIEKLQAEKQSYYEVSQEGESAIVNAEKKDASSINRTKIDIEIYNLQSELRDLLAKEADADEKGKDGTEKDGDSKDEPENGDESKEESGKDDKSEDEPKKEENDPEKNDSPEVKALKDKIKILEDAIKSKEGVLLNGEGNYIASDLKEIKEKIGELKAEHAELIEKLNDLEKGLKNKDSKEKDDDANKNGEPTKDSDKDNTEGKEQAGKAKEKDNKDNKNPEMATYRIGPFKRFLMNVIRKIKSWAKADGRISKICDSLEGAVIGSATPLIDGATEEKEAKKALNLGKVKDFEKEVADAKNAEYSKEKYEQADNHVEAKAKLDLADMEYIKDVIMKAWDSKETNLMTEVFNKQYKEGFRGEDGINEDELKKFIKDNNIPSVTKTDRINAALWRTSQSIVEMAKEKGFVVNQGKGKNANAKPLSEIYPSLEARIKTDRVSEEYSKKEEKTSETFKDGKVKASNDKSENDSKVVKEEDDLDK